MTAMTDGQFSDNEAASRFELAVDGQVAYATYRLEGKTLYIDYVEAPPALRGTGAAGRLMEQVAALAEAQHYTIVPICGYAASWFRRHRGKPPERGSVQPPS